MNIFSIFSRGRGNGDQPQKDGRAAACQHAVLIPRWDSPDDMGKRDKVSFYLCDRCQATLSREEGDRLQVKTGEGR